MPSHDMTPEEMRDEIAHLSRGILAFTSAYLAAIRRRPQAAHPPIEEWLEEHRRRHWEREYRQDMARVDVLPDIHDPADR